MFIVGPWVKKAGNDPESQRLVNAENMNGHLNWHADEVLTFELTIWNPLKVRLPISMVELFAEGNEKLVSLDGTKDLEELEP